MAVTAAIMAGSMAAGASAGPIAGQFGKGRRTADEFVQGYQNAFQSRVAAIIDPITAGRKAGTLEYKQVSGAQSRLEAAIQEFEQQAADFEKSDRPEAYTVVQNARRSLAPIVQSWRSSLAKDLEGLAPPPAPEDNPALNPPTLTSVLGGETLKKKAEGAAEQLRKRTAGLQGRASTLLTREFKPTSVEKRTILGY